MKPKFDQYIHELINSDGRTVYTVAAYDAESNEYWRPMDSGEQKMTGCHTYFAKKLEDLGGGGGYYSRRDALRRARYLFGK